jgi:hypothetical protein
MSAVADKLRVARALVAKGWTQEVFARDRRGKEVRTAERSAACWCAYGAVIRADAEYDGYVYLSRAIGLTGQLISQWNDEPTRTQQEVLAAFDRAIELAEQAA